MPILTKYQIGAAEYKFPSEDKWVTNKCVTFPFLVPSGSEHTVARVKVRSITEKANQRFDPGGGRPSLFGQHLVKSTDKQVILTGLPY